MILARRLGVIPVAFLLLIALAPRVAFSASVHCDSSDGLPDFNTASDGSSCDTDGDGTSSVKATASSGGSASATGFNGGSASARASGKGSAKTDAPIKGVAQATSSSCG